MKDVDVIRYTLNPDVASNTPETGAGSNLSANWAVKRLENALRSYPVRAGPAGNVHDRIIDLRIDPTIGAETFRISQAPPQGGCIVITGGDAPGLGLGCLHLADALDRGQAPEDISETTVRPRLSIRALKVNLPWASYRQHVSLDLHAEAQRDFAFWEALLDHMALSRLNMLTLWSLHPFYYMVDVPEFPEARSVSVDQMEAWQRLWKQVFGAAHQRGIQTYVFFWNIFVSPGFMEAHDVCRYCEDWNYIGDGDDSDLIRRYNRACVRTLIDAYDDLDGIGVAMSERMGGMTPAQRADWVEQVIIPGMHDAGRVAGLCLRVPHSAGLNNGGSTDRASESIGRTLLERVDVPGRLWTEVKFNWSHGHSTPHLRKIHGGAPSDVLWNPPPEKYELAWMVRNEDFFVLRWADSDFVREHIRNNARAGVTGYLIGSECYIPAHDYISRPDTDARYAWAFERQWLFYQIWGRLLYDPTTPDRHFEALIDQRYQSGIGGPLLAAMKIAGRTPLRIATFLNFTWDHTLYAEGMLNREGIVTINDMIAAEPIEPQWMGIRRFLAAGERADGPNHLTPPVLAARCLEDANEVRRLVAPLAGSVGNLGEEVLDIHAWAELSDHFAHKLLAALSLARFVTTGQQADRDQARDHARQALKHWQHLASMTEKRYRPIPLQILGDRPFSWAALADEVQRDLEAI